jgi:hypothetical protein
MPPRGFCRRSRGRPKTLEQLCVNIHALYLNPSARRLVASPPPFIVLNPVSISLHCDSSASESLGFFGLSSLCWSSRPGTPSLCASRLVESPAQGSFLPPTAIPQDPQAGANRSSDFLPDPCCAFLPQDNAQLNSLLPIGNENPGSPYQQEGHDTKVSGTTLPAH